MSGAQTPAAPPTQFQSPAASLRSLSATLREDERRTPPPTAASARAATAVPTAGRPGMQSRQAGAVQQSLLVAKDAEVTLLRQQLAQLTADFRYNLKLLEERDLELERTDSVLAGLRDAAAAKELALREAQGALAGAQAALRDREASLAALEERHRSALALCDHQVADARAARDEELAKYAAELAAVQGEAARQKSDTIARYEEQLSAAAAAEQDARQRSQQLAEENEHVRSMLQRAEARVAEQELGMQRMVGQFESALQTLAQLEAQYDSLAADAGAAERVRTARIAELEAECECLRAARAAAQQERDGTAASLGVQLKESERAMAEAKQRYHRAMMDNADLTEALGKLKQEAQELRSKCQQLEAECHGLRDEQRQAAAAAEREGAAHAHTRGLLETTRLQLEAARREAAAAQETGRRDATAQQEEAAALRETVALLEAQCNDSTQALEAVHAKLAAADERAALLADQVEQERAMHSQLITAREAETEARWTRALQTAQDERAKLQQTLDLANRQLAQAHRDIETLRLQLQHLRLAQARPGASLDSHLLRTAGGGAGLGADEGGEASLGETGSETSRDVFADLPEYPSTAQPSASAGSSSYRRLHLDSLAGRLDGYERAMERAAAQQAGSLGSARPQQAEKSGQTAPPANQQRQAEDEAGEGEQIHHRLAREREYYEIERRRLDEQLAEKQQRVQEREQELRQLRGPEGLQSGPQQEQQQHEHLPRHQVHAEGQRSGAPLPPSSLAFQRRQQQQHQASYAVPHLQAGHLAAENAALRHQIAALRLSSLNPSPAASSLAPSSSPRLGSSLGGMPAPAASVRAAWGPGGAAAAPALGPRLHTTLGANGGTGHASLFQRPLPSAPPLGSRPGTGGSFLSQPSAAGVGAGGVDPLAKARQQVQQAKEYLRHAAEWGSKMSRAGGGPG
eukprot:scaffold2.g7523.t1